MGRTNPRTEKSRDLEDPTRRVTRQSTRALPPVIISEPQEQTTKGSSRRERPTRDRRRKGKRVAVEQEYQSSERDDETLRNILFGSRQMAENQHRLFGDVGGSSTGNTTVPSRENSPDPQGNDDWYDDPKLEFDYLDTRMKQNKFRYMLEDGLSREDAYTELEVAISREKETEVIHRTKSRNMREAFLKNNFEGTYYPHLPTMEKLGLSALVRY